MSYVKCHDKPYDPFGVNHPPPECQENIKKFWQGDEITFTSKVSYNGEPATPSNCRVNVVLKDQRFIRDIIWEGEWNDGVAETENPGVLRITMPASVYDALRRGAFIYSVDVSDPTGDDRKTVEEGTLLIDYAANAPVPDVPYRSDV